MAVVETFKLAEISLKVFLGLKETFGESLKKAWVNFNFDDYARAYAKKMRDEYGKVQILKMNFPIDLEGVQGIYTQVRILRNQTAQWSGEEEQIKRTFLKRGYLSELHDKPVDALEELKAHNKLFILGKPGAGKTTFMKHVTMRADLLERLPIFVRLVDFAKSDQFRDGGDDGLILFISLQFKLCDAKNPRQLVDLLLEKRKAVLLFDGLDEVNKENGVRDRVIRQLRDFCRRYGCSAEEDGNKIVVTCRIAASDYTFEGFHYVEMADFDDKQIAEFVEKWFRSEDKGPELQARFKIEFKRAKHSGVRELARNPLMLTLLCWSFRKSLAFRSRSEIFADAIDKLVEEWDTTRLIRRDPIVEGLTPPKLKQMFARIAYHSFERERDVIFKQSRLEGEIKEYITSLPGLKDTELLDSKAILKEIESQTGMFVARAEGIYTYAHLALHEYFTASYLTANIHNQKVLQTSSQQLGEEGWREVLLLTAEILDDGEVLITGMLDELDEYLISSRRTRQYLEWLQLQIGVIENPYTLLQQKVCVVYISACTATSFASALHRARPSDRKTDVASTLDLSRTLDIARNLTRNLDIVGVRRRSRDFSLVLDLAKTVNHSLALDLALSHACARGFDYAFALALSIARKFNAETKIISYKLGEKELYSALRELVLPNAKAAVRQWEDYSEELWKLMNQYREWNMYEFTKKEANHLAGYLERTKLVLDCLKVTNMSPEARKRVEARILTPPKKIR